MASSAAIVTELIQPRHPAIERLARGRSRENLQHAYSSARSDGGFFFAYDGRRSSRPVFSALMIPKTELASDSMPDPVNFKDGMSHLFLHVPIAMLISDL
jgi:hypothetical protein